MLQLNVGFDYSLGKAVECCSENNEELKIGTKYLIQLKIKGQYTYLMGKITEALRVNI